MKLSAQQTTAEAPNLRARIETLEAANKSLRNRAQHFQECLRILASAIGTSLPDDPETQPIGMGSNSLY